MLRPPWVAPSVLSRERDGLRPGGFVPLNGSEADRSSKGVGKRSEADTDVQSVCVRVPKL